MVTKILKTAIDELNALNLKEKRRGNYDTQMILDLRNEIVALKLTYEDYMRRKID